MLLSCRRFLNRNECSPFLLNEPFRELEHFLIRFRVVQAYREQVLLKDFTFVSKHVNPERFLASQQHKFTFAVL